MSDAPISRDQSNMPRAERVALLSLRTTEIADWIERDRREPDKVMCNVQALRRLAREIAEEADRPVLTPVRESDLVRLPDLDSLDDIQDGPSAHEWLNGAPGGPV